VNLPARAAINSAPIARRVRRPIELIRCIEASTETKEFNPNGTSQARSIPELISPDSAVAPAFVKDMKSSFAEEEKHRQDVIAARQLSIFEYQGRREEPLRVSDIKEMFRELKGIVG
jgi:hypothetical protein